MAKLTKAETTAHEAASALLAKNGELTHDEAIDVVCGWHEGASHLNTRASAHFTPWDYARHVALESTDGRVLDLCAGIGILSLAIQNQYIYSGGVDLTLVEINPDYCAVAQRVLPDARVICGSLFDPAVRAELAGEKFDTVVSNPPFGNFARGEAAHNAPNYTGGELHYAVIDIASELGNHGVFVLPQMAVPFQYSGQASYKHTGGDDRYRRFKEQTCIELQANCGIDTAALPPFRGVKIVTEIATADFEEARAKRLARDLPLFSEAA